jgi:glycosyltransferase involved in cell wall biosynthesis
MMPSISVIIPSTRPEMLKEAVRSIVRQQYEGKIEVIIVTDPPDHAKFEEVISSLTNKYARLDIIHVRTPKPRSGPSVARNIGIQKASHEIIGFIDDDDFWLRGKLNLQLKYLTLYKLDVLLTSCINLFTRNLYKKYPLTIKGGFNTSQV